MKTYLTPLFMLLLFSLGCSDFQNKKRIIGKWQGVSWHTETNVQIHDAAATQFSFTEDGKYVFNYGESIENGTYKIEGNMLFTKADGMDEMAVAINRLSDDSLIFDMNRGGQSEKLVLVKE